MKGFLYNDVKGIIFSLLLKTNKIGIVRTIKTNVTLYTNSDICNYLHRNKMYWHWCYNNELISIGHRILYFINNNYSLISIINGSVYLFVRDKLESIEEYGYQGIKTYKDIYNYLEKTHI